MGNLVSTYIFPHPPIVVPEIGRGKEKESIRTLDGLRKASQEIKNDRPDTIIVITPHAPIFSDHIYISGKEKLEGDFGNFGAGRVSFKFDNNISLVNSITKFAEREGISAGIIDDSLTKLHGISEKIDHGALVPLYFVREVYSDFKLVHMAIGGLPKIDLYKFGMCMERAIKESDERVVIIASGDLSHRLSEDGPYGYNENGKVFDQLIVRGIQNITVRSFLECGEELCENAGECGLRSFIMMLGALDGYELKSHLYSYEGPFGVGYAVAKFTVGDKKKQSIFNELYSEEKEKINTIKNDEDEYVSLARNTLETFIKTGKIIHAPDWATEEMKHSRAGVFVSIKKHGELRGCIGTIEPTRKNISEEIIYNAISAGTRDPRFNPVEEGELDSLVYSVDVLEEAEDISSMDELDVKKYGVIVKSGRRQGLLLPNLEGVDTAEYQVSIALSKAGISPNEDYSMERFEVTRHK